MRRWGIFVGSLFLAFASCAGKQAVESVGTTTTQPTTTLSPATTVPKTPSETVKGSILVWSETPAKSSLSAGKSCDGVDIGYGYTDIRGSSPVFINDIKGEVIKRTELDYGFVTNDSKGCCLTFSVELEKGTDGDNGFVFQLGKSGLRGDSRVTWEQIEKEEAGLELALTVGTPKGDGDLGSLSGPAGKAVSECALTVLN